jgi:4-amino-4-deoxy-L-arabinose transferase-like glycosyltransferase
LIASARNKNIWLTGLLLFVCSLWIRLYYIQGTQVNNPVKSDAANYVIYTGNLLNNHTFSKEQSKEPRPDSYWAPGYPVFLALNTLVSRKFNLYDYKIILFSQALLSSLIVVLTFLLGRMLFRDGWALAAALLCMLSPHLISYSAVLLTETLFSFLLLSALYIFCLFLDKQNISLGILSGTFFGMAYLTNPVSMFLPVLIVATALTLPNRLTVRKSVPIIAIFLIIAFSWNIRNSINVDNDSLSSSDRLFTNLVVGAHPDYQQIWKSDPRDPTNPAVVDMSNFSGSYSAFVITMLNRIKLDPARYLEWYFIDKPIQLWQWNVGIGFGDIFIYPVVTTPYHTERLAIASHVIMKSMHLWLFLFAVLGTAISVFYWTSTPMAACVIIITTLYISAVYVVTQADARYSVPLRPEMYLMAIFFIEQVSAKVAHIRNRTPSR